MYKPFTKMGTYYKQNVNKIVCMTKTLLDDEVWKKHPKLEDIEVSNYGRVRKIIKTNGIEEYKYEILSQYEESDRSDGYLKVNVSDKKSYYVYKLVVETFKSIDNQEGYEVHHINNNGHENTPENLIWLTKEQHTGKNGVHTR